MKILKMSFKGYRNLKENKIEFSPEINFVFGKNAQGKTNLIEAIWMFTGARSFRGTKDADLVNFNSDFAKIDGNFFFENRDHEITIIFNGGKRKAIFPRWNILPIMRGCAFSACISVLMMMSLRQ